ncbi:MAG: rhodoquinone biosynthesis methyltransferase RquA [Alphaproteobacteria bacterium]
MSDNNSSVSVELPEYMKKIHHWAYLNPTMVSFLNNIMIVYLKSFFYAGKLAKLAANEVNPKDAVLQMGTTYGDQIYAIADKVGDDGFFDIIDISKIQLKKWKDQLGAYPQTQVYNLDAENTPPTDRKYDVVLSFFLLHELPDPKKTRVIDNMLNCLKNDPHAKAVFIDFSNPAKMNPLKYLIKPFAFLYSPFTESLFEKDISSFASNADDYIWRKETFLGGVYQKTIAMKKP